MNVIAQIVDGPITPALEDACRKQHAAQCDSGRTGEVGATLRFDGIVRLLEADAQHDGTPRPLAGLRYETYDPMAERELTALAKATAERHGLIRLAVIHSRGLVRVGEVSLVLEVQSRHRAEAIAAMTEFIDRLKQHVPIWKHAVWH